MQDTGTLRVAADFLPCKTTLVMIQAVTFNQVIENSYHQNIPRQDACLGRRLHSILHT
jgi:hypothetical protein